MGATVTANEQTVIHKDSGGTLVTTPDVCKTQVGSAIVPIPYVNVAKSKDTSKGSKTVTMDGNPVMRSTSAFSKSSGDEPGKIGGVVSNTHKGKAKLVTTSNDVIVEGKPVGRRTDLMISNQTGSGNTPPAALQQPNAGAGPKNNNGYILLIIPEFKHPNIVTGEPDPFRLNLPYTVSGPETYQYQAKDFYQKIDRMMAQPGAYSFKIDDFRLEDSPITQKVKDKPPV